MNNYKIKKHQNVFQINTIKILLRHNIPDADFYIIIASHHCNYPKSKKLMNKQGVK